MVCLIKCFNKHNWTKRTYDDYVYVLNRFSVKRAMLLEFSQYLENYLWLNFNAAKVCKHEKKAILRIVDVVSFCYAQTVNLEREWNLRVTYTQIHCFILQCSCELSQFLSYFNCDFFQASVEYVMSVIVMVNEKFREGVPPWEVRISNIHYMYVWPEENLAAWWLEHWTGEWKVQVHEAVIYSSTRC